MKKYKNTVYTSKTESRYKLIGASGVQYCCKTREKKRKYNIFLITLKKQILT